MIADRCFIVSMNEWVCWQGRRFRFLLTHKGRLIWMACNKRKEEIKKKKNNYGSWGIHLPMSKSKACVATIVVLLYILFRIMGSLWLGLSCVIKMIYYFTEVPCWQSIMSMFQHMDKSSSIFNGNTSYCWMSFGVWKCQWPIRVSNVSIGHHTSTLSSQTWLEVMYLRNSTCGR